MKTPSIILCVLGCLLALGCRLNPRIAMLEQECRIHEDAVYAMQDQLNMAQNALIDAQQENTALRQKLDGGDFSGSSSKKNGSTEAPPTLDIKLPGTGTQEVSPDALENMNSSPTGPGVVDPNARESLQNSPTPPAPGDQSPAGNSGAYGQPQREKTQVRDGKVLYQEEGPRLRGDSEEVQEITISNLMTGGVNADSQKGDEGLFVVVEPRDGQGHLVPAAGPISLIAFDPALPKEKAQVARWDFSEKELAAQFRRSGSAEGFHLEVRWPDMPPRHEHLKLFVRYVTADARKLYAQAPVRVALMPKKNTIVARPEPRRRTTARSDGWSSRPNTRAVEAQPSPRIASRPAGSLNQSIPPASEDPIYTRRPKPRTRPVWSPER
ncbi:MAG: hypothetical protein PVH19_08945 [Planctomycetia bacterium]